MEGGFFDWSTVSAWDVTFALLPVQPWWSFIVLALDIFVLYALTVHGKELKSAS